MKTVIAMRHGEKKGDALTALGAAQCFATANRFKEMFNFKIDRVLHSGANRAQQAANVAAAGLGLMREQPQLWREWYFAAGIDGFFDSEAEMVKFWATIESGTVPEIIARYPFFAKAREMLQKNLIVAAAEMCERNENAILVVSHSGWLELPTLNANQVFEKIPLAGAIAYVIEGSTIVSSELIEPPPVSL